jgi:membrane protein YqaA with SNARE-associated domain
MNPFGSLLICVAGWMNRNQQEVIAYLFVIRLATHEVQIAGIVPEPNERWMNQMARNLTDP